MDLAGFRAHVGAVIGTDVTAGSEDEGFVDDWVNQAVIRVLEDTRCYATRTTVATTAGIGDYTLDTDILMLIGWTYQNTNGETPRLRQVEPEEILDMRAFQGSAGDPIDRFAIIAGPAMAKTCAVVTFVGGTSNPDAVIYRPRGAPNSRDSSQIGITITAPSRK
jgi:hypothetical protein